MTIEEKAKAYDEALEIARGLYAKDAPDSLHLERMFPILKEDEDDKIRKELLNAFIESTDSLYMVLTPLKREAFIAWLEKQGEHANFRNKIQIGDKVTRNRDGMLVNLSQLNRVAKKDENQEYQKPADKVEPKFKVGDEIRTKNEESLIITRIDRWGYWSEDLFICGFDEECMWDLVEQKPTEWSEEDEDAIGMAIIALEDMYDEDAPNTTYGGYNLSFKKAAERLKSLRPQGTWKPSEEHMKWLHDAIESTQYEPRKQALISLYSDLMKLKEE